jgi:hypothetical protein
LHFLYAECRYADLSDLGMQWNPMKWNEMAMRND